MGNPKYPGGLKLIDVTFVQINDVLDAYPGKMTAHVQAEVPDGTVAVHISVGAMSVSFGSGDGTPRLFRRFGFKIANEDVSRLADGVYKCDFEAHLETDDDAVPWTPYFVLEILCFA